MNKLETHALDVQTQVGYRGAVANPMDEGMPEWSPGRAERRNAGIDSLAAFSAPSSPCTQTHWSRKEPPEDTTTAGGRVLVCRKNPGGLKPKPGFQRDRNSRKVPEAFRRMWNPAEGGRCRKVVLRWIAGL
jgi:hypothetical protein